MEIVRATGEILSASMPIIYTGAGIATGLLAIVGLTYRIDEVGHFISKTIFRRPQFNYLKIFNKYIEKLKSIENPDEMFNEILSITCKVLDASGASIIIIGEKEDVRVSASLNLSTFTIKSHEISNFLSWIGNKGTAITRSQMLQTNLPSNIKNECLRYCVLSNAEACTPIYIRKKLYALLNLGPRKKNEYDYETQKLLEALVIFFTSEIRRVNLQQELVRQKLSLEQATGLRSTLLTNLSHEIRTPLNSIIGLSEILKDETNTNILNEQKEHISMIHESGKRLLTTLNSIVELSKVEANHLELNVQKINLKRLLDNIGEKINFNQHTKLKIDLKKELSSVYGDELRLSQVFYNILDNAAKFTKHGNVSVDSDKCGDMLKIKISDTGIGIPDSKKNLILDGFYQADNGAARSYEGLGLGLVMSKKIVKLHGGRLWFSSKVGRGTNFYVTLPLKPIGINHHQIEHLQ